MTQRDWIEKDYYRELGVSSTASQDEIKKAYRKLARELHPDANPGDEKAEARFKAVSEAYGVLGDEAKRKEYDETRAMFAGGGGFGGFGSGGGFPGGGAGGAGGPGGIDINDLFGQAGRGGGGSGDFSDIFGRTARNSGGAGAGGFGAAGARRGQDVESSLTISFDDAVRGATVPIQLSSPGRCERCGGTGSRPGSTPRTCVTCGGAGLVNRSQGAFSFSEPCRDCRGTGRIIDDPCPECRGDGVSTRTRSLSVRVPAGVDNGQKVRLAGQGEPGRGGAPAGDLYVTVSVTPHRIFGRSPKNADDLTITVPVTFQELVLGATLTVPTLDSTVSLKIPAGTSSGRTFRVAGRGVERKNGKKGNLLVTVEVAVPQKLDQAATDALQAYAEATKSIDPRADLLGSSRR
ncbi:Chaperone protein DnaJ [Pseudonocardia sp. Ae168_Ps1]|uniref:molecular chaperone DnaJ n=1 Tax=unclassified Pseudonocardia TaxID=2619320 RepID=UPI00094AFD89|nr:MULTISPECIES: molecular chaperone DnaJ [unclassified Pseudonocardia]OLL74887.1 Chaperone protein DnaJ [Pseudonocardia sp. Ae150A_Ps1]OLL80879.1 Chaperone protein DnaJ [Pseudonocardia sp. Ae168_Ps1]OLL85003.1 Chaperone protein DnaJ [Pseudonocardia sp. Ae263_Ps1]OLL94980.1 Chaperone protein DnaJ [Pseudonocardia sp. Ae356_Ps1]